MDSYNNLKKILSNKWELVTMQAEEQLKVAKDRKKARYKWLSSMHIEFCIARI